MTEDLAEQNTATDRETAAALNSSKLEELAQRKRAAAQRRAEEAAERERQQAEAPQAPAPAVDEHDDEALLAKAREWRQVALSTGTVDRVAAERAIRELYRATVGSEPESIEWCASPREAARLVAERGTSDASVREAVRTLPWRAARTVAASVWGEAEWARRQAVLAPALRRLGPTVTSATERGLVAETEDRQLATRLRIALTYAVSGQFDAGWIAAFDGLADARTDEDESAESARIRRWIAAYGETVRRLSWWWPFQKTVIACERPATLLFDDADRLHSGDGPALAYADGFALYRWRGAVIPADFAETLATLTASRIRAEENAELRRIMFEHFGYERFIAESGAKPVHQDETGRLWRIVLPGDEPVAMVEVVNATPEPDGSFNTYWLRVPPHLRTARAGVAWTFGLSEEDYQPQIQT